MIERDLLLRLAREFAESKAKERPNLKAAYLIGSVARSEPPLGDATDLDIVLVDPDPLDDWQPYKRISDSVLIDYFYTTPEHYDNKLALRRDPFYGPSLFNGVSLHDPHHFFDLVQAAVRSQIDKAENVYARARTTYRWAAESFEAIQHYRFQPVPRPVPCNVLMELQRVIEFGVTTILLINYKQHAARRHLVTFEAVTRQIDRMDLYTLALQALGVDDLQHEEIDAIREDWAQLYSAANRYNPHPYGDAQIVDPARRLYYLRGFETLAEAGHAHNAMLLLEQTLTTCVDQIEKYAPLEDVEIFREIYDAYLARTHKGNANDFEVRVKQTGDFLQQIDDLLINWAHHEGIPA